MNDNRRPYTFDRVIRILFTAIAVIGSFFFLHLIKGALLPFLIAWLIAYLLNPMVEFYQNRLRIRNRALAILATFVSITLVIGGICWLIIPSIMNEAGKTQEIIESLIVSPKSLPHLPVEWQEWIMEKVNLQELSGMLNPDEWTKLAENTLSSVWQLLAGSFNALVSVVGSFIVILYLIFILLDYDKIIAGFRSLIPESYRAITLGILEDVEDGMNRYFRGQSFIALLVGILFSIGFLIIGLPLAIPLGLFIGLLNLVPYLQIVGILPTTLLCFLGAYGSDGNFWLLFGLAMVVFIVVQTIQDVYITPRVMGAVTGLNPAVILLSLSIWGTLLGVMGMIIALPFTTLLLSYYEKYILKRYALSKEEKKLTDEPPENEHSSDM